jgi:hypothetical protein
MRSFSMLKQLVQQITDVFKQLNNNLWCLLIIFSTVAITNSSKYKRRENRDTDNTSSLFCVSCSYIGQRLYGRSVLVASIKEHFLGVWNKCQDEVQWMDNYWSVYVWRKCVHLEPFKVIVKSKDMWSLHIIQGNTIIRRHGNFKYLRHWIVQRKLLEKMSLI